MPRYSFVLATVLATATTVSAHGHVTNVVVNGVSYDGFDINSYPYMSDPPKVAAWTTPNTGNGFIAPDQYADPNIICHQSATPAQAHIVVAAGDKINIQWTEWPESHHGPVVDYLARCDGSCSDADKTTLKFFKISGVGLVNGSSVPGVWGDDQLIENNHSWMVQIPKSIAPGNYVLRHELIALHGAFEQGGAQNYPQCFNLQVTGSGTDQPTGVLGTELYTSTDAGLLVDIYKSLDSYVVPGPSLYSGASEIAQATSAITATGTATTGSSSGNAIPTTSAAATGTAAASTSAVTSSSVATSLAGSARTPSVASSVPAPGSSSTSTRTTLASVTSTAVSTSSTAPSSTAPSAGATQKLYEQCGGRMWTGSTTCVEGATCHQWNEYYSQCVSRLNMYTSQATA